MTAEAILDYNGNELHGTATAALDSGQIVELAGGQAAYVDGLQAKAAGDSVNYKKDGIITVAKTTDIVFLDGAEVFWDHSANKTILRPANDRDFRLGLAVGDSAAADTSMQVDLNAVQSRVINLQSSGFDTVIVKTVVGSTTVEVPQVINRGGATVLSFGTTAEAQKVDLLSQRSFPVGSNWIMEFVANLVANSDNAAGDLNIGVANGTHASDADSITESCFIHMDGASLNINAESDDGTTEVAATDTTVDAVVGTPFHVVIDGRDESDIQLYINGALVLGSTVFTLAAATGPLKALVHWEKSSDDSPGTLQMIELHVRIQD